LIRTQVAPMSWTTVGGTGEMTEPRPGLLTINHNFETHHRIESLLTAVRRLDREFAADKRRVAAPVIPLQVSPSHPFENAPLVDFHFKGPLNELQAAMEKPYGVTVLMNSRDLDEIGVNSDTPINDRVRNASPADVLRKFLEPHGLCFITRPDCVVISNPDAA